MDSGKLLIAGSRTIDNYDLLKMSILTSKFNATEVISGGAYGVDLMGEQWAKENNVPVNRFIPEWRKGGKFDRGAGIRRNIIMVNNCNFCVIIWDGLSKGTESTINIMKRSGKPLFLVNTSNDQCERCNY